jgi:hypothetical protein
MKKKSLFAIVGGGLSLAMAAVAIGGFAAATLKAPAMLRTPLQALI